MIYLKEKCGIAHRDLKPKNILITQKDVTKIADFGEAKENLMKIGSISMIGTPDYLSPYRFENCFCGGQ